MKYLALILLAALTWVDPATVKKINETKSAAESSFKKGDYSAAIEKYRYLVDSLNVREDEVMLNLAHAYYLAKDTANAYSGYQSVTTSPDRNIRSSAQLQLGLIANQQGRPEEALNHFRESIKANPSNDDARYNYEMVKKKLQEQNDQDDQQQQNQDKQDQQNQQQQKEEQQQNKDEQQNKDDQQEQQQDEKDAENQQRKDQQEQQKKNEQEQQEQQEAEKESELPNVDREKLEQMKISEEKARMILEAMKNQEKQYLQQQKRKATQSRDRNKPDW
jgi:Ca-activated chloride channel family protein